MQVGNIVKSLKGHDTGRIYVVMAVLGDDFVLLVDGKYRKTDNPKQKRVKHLEVIKDGEVTFPVTDALLRKMCKL